MTYREIEEELGTNIRYVTEAIKQFKDDIYNTFYGGCNQSDIDNI
jgi:hypothetical protein